MPADISFWGLLKPNPFFIVMYTADDRPTGGVQQFGFLLLAHARCPVIYTSYAATNLRMRVAQ